MKRIENAVVKTGVLIQKRGKLLLIKEKGWANKKYLWNIVKGTFDPQKDKDIFETAKREAWEEAGATIRVRDILNILFLKKRPGVFIQFNFVADLVGSRVAIANRNMQRKYREDITELRFFTKEELRRMRRNKFIGERTYQSVRAWLRGERHSKSLLPKLNTY